MTRIKTLWAGYGLGLGYALYLHLGAEVIVQLAGLIVAMLMVLSILVTMLAAGAEALEALRGLLEQPPTVRGYGELATGDVPSWFAERL